MPCKRNLYFYIHPRKHDHKPATWRWNVYQLLRHLDAFTGRRLVVIATDETTEAADVVQDDFPWNERFEFVRVQNHKTFGEAAHFLEALERLQSQDPDEFTFYAHAKGVTKPAYEVPQVMAWANMMYEMNLSYPDQIDMLMQQFDAIGCMRIEGGSEPAKYIFGGNYFWMKHSALFSKNWKTILESYYGAERYIGAHIPLDRSFALTQGIPINMYQVKFPQSVLRRWLERLSRLSLLELHGRNVVPWTF
jgi:hypothetical protein